MSVVPGLGADVEAFRVGVVVVATTCAEELDEVVRTSTAGSGVHGDVPVERTEISESK